MKKIISIVLVLFLAFGLVACSNDNEGGKNIDQVNRNIKDKKSFILIASSTSCAACKAYKPVLKEFKKKEKNLTIIDVPIDKIKDLKVKNDFASKYAIESTPTTIFFKNGEVSMVKEKNLTLVVLEELYNNYMSKN